MKIVSVLYGLEKCCHIQRIGVCKKCWTWLVAAKTKSEETVGFQIAPRLNALGRSWMTNPVPLIC